MSGSGDYTIQSRIEYYPVVGIAPPIIIPPGGGVGPVIPYEEVHINGTGAWHLTQQGNDIYEFNVVGRYPYTGLRDKSQPDGSAVIATDSIEDNRLWYVTQVPGSEDYTIALADDRQLFWTVDGINAPQLRIVLQRYPDAGVPSYGLFRLVRL